MRKSLLITLVGLLLLTSSVFAQEERPRFGFEPFYWQSKLEGDITISETNIPGTKIDFKDELDLEETKGIPGGEIWLRVRKRSKLSLSYFEVEHKGQENITRSFTYKGTTYNVGLDVSSKLKTQVATLTHQFNFIQGKWVELGFLWGAEYLAFESEIEAPGIAEQRARIEGLIPVIGLASRINFSKYLSWDTKVSGIGGDYADVQASLIDGWSRLTLNVTENLGIGAGYRYLDLSAEYLDNEASLTYSGPAAFLTARF
ncbi:hypothetical protein KKD34_00910 [bacterium]|nr:hypothetical protein [bacterium]